MISSPVPPGGGLQHGEPAYAPGLTIALAWDRTSRQARLQVSHWSTGESVEFAVDLAAEQAQYVYCQPLGLPAGSASLRLAG